MRRLLFTGPLCEYASRRTRDVMYRLLTDASPYGRALLQAQLHEGEMRPLLVPAGQARGGIDAPRPPRVHLLATRDGRHVPRLHRGDCRKRRRRFAHAAQHNVQLASQHRRALETGLLLADGPAERQGSAVWHELIAATHFVLEKAQPQPRILRRRSRTTRPTAYRDARAARADGRDRSAHPRAGGDGVDSDPLQQLAARGRQVAHRQVDGCLDRNRRGRGDAGGSVRLLLPATLGDIPGAETQTPDIRDQPGGDALFQFWMENRRKEDERLGRDRGRAGGGDRDG